MGRLFSFFCSTFDFLGAEITQLPLSFFFKHLKNAVSFCCNYGWNPYSLFIYFFNVFINICKLFLRTK